MSDTSTTSAISPESPQATSRGLSQYNFYEDDREQDESLDLNWMPHALETVLQAEQLSVPGAGDIPTVGWAEHWSGDRRADWDRILMGLYRTDSPNILLVGDGGTGKSAWLRELARHARSGEVPFLHEVCFVQVHAERVLPDESGAVLGDLFAAAASSPRKVVLCVNGFAHLLRGRDGVEQTGELLAALDRTGVRLIGELDGHAYRELISGRRAIQDRFTTVEVAPPDESLIRKIVQVHAEAAATSHGFGVSDDFADRLVEVTSQTLVSRPSPEAELAVVGRTIDRLRYCREVGGADETELSVAACLPEIAVRSGLPEEVLRGEPSRLNFHELLSNRVFGQEEAVAAVAEELSLLRVGLTGAGRPAAVLLFAGLTGVGKTELAKAVAEVYSSSGRLRTYSMGNYTEPHSVSGIIGVPPGYVGHEQGGPLVSDLQADPSAVFLLDEAEKAHPNVWKPFLTLFDEGWIIDQRGRKGYADRAIFILTTNAGDRAIAQMSDSGAAAHSIADRVRHTLSRVRHERSSQPVFPPQFLARIGRTLVFRPLSTDALLRIARGQLERARRLWERRFGLEIVFAPGLAERVTDVAVATNDAAGQQEGGRIVGKLIHDRIEVAVLRAANSPDDIGRTTRLRVDATLSPPDSESDAIPSLSVTCIPAC